MARRGPVVCAALLDSLSSDAALARLMLHGETAADAAGAQTAGEMVVAIEALRSATWQLLRGELRAGDADLAEPLADRLAHACAALLESAFAAPATAEFAGGSDDDDDVSADGNSDVEADGARRKPHRRAIVPVADGSVAIASGPEGEPWRPTIEKRLKRHAVDKLDFAVFAVEVDDLERLLATGDEAADAIELAERAISATLRPGDVLVRERSGRYWIAAPETEELAARILGEQLSVAVGDAAEHHGVPLTASIGIAVCPQHGTEAHDLAAHADEAVYAARASGVRLA
jgi:GGDEF domain-containing protein